MTLFEGLQASPTLLVVAVAILGLLVGSFLNVVILRLPRIMEQNWKRDARDALELPAIEEPSLSLSHPASCCPSCKAPIRPWQNVPVISWLALRGRCANCRAPISAQYPLVEASCALLSAVCAWPFGYGAALIAARSEARRVGKGCVRTGRSRWVPVPLKKK